MVFVYGGSFNPPTTAHEAIIHKLYNQFKPNQIIVIPTGNYFSWKNDLIDFKHRYQMVYLITKDLPYCSVSDIENINAFLGTYHTLKILQNDYKDLYFVVGADHIKTLENWKNYEALIKEFKFIILTRKDVEFDKDLLQKLNVNYKILEFESAVSSSKVRNNLEQNLDNLNPLVKEYIQNNNLYERVNV